MRTIRKQKSFRIKRITDSHQKHYLEILADGIFDARNFCFRLQVKYPNDDDVKMTILELDHVHNIVGEILILGDAKYFEKVLHPAYLKDKQNPKK